MPIGALLRRKNTQLGPPVHHRHGHKPAKLVYSTLRYGQKYEGAGTEYCETPHQQRAPRAAKRRAAQLAPMPP